jgi:hypothetical protein
MSNIGGKKRESKQLPEFSKKVGLFESRVIAINPDAEDYKDLLNIELKEDSKTLEYLTTNDTGDAKLRVDIWLEEVKNKDKFKMTFYLENKVRKNKDLTKKQYINNVGVSSWAENEEALPTWFAKRDYREAHVGEDDLYNFLRTWLGGLDYSDAETTLELDWKRLMKGNTKDLKEQITGGYDVTFIALATIKTVTKDDEIKEYQGVYNKDFLPSYFLKQFRLVDYSNSNVLKSIQNKTSKDLKGVERFVKGITGEYGCKEFYILKDLKDYNAEDNLVASDETFSTDGSDF